MAEYKEPELTFLVLDFKKEVESRLCLKSIKRHVKFPHKVIYLHNGGDENYPIRFLNDGLVDQFIQTKDNNGLGIGTRDLFAASFSQYSFYLQNDQFIFRDFTQEEFDRIKAAFYQNTSDNRIVKTVSLAGSPCGVGVYSERAHIIKTEDYKRFEFSGLLGYHGAGKYHNGPWREEQIQTYYKDNGFVHYPWDVLVQDNGKRAIRQNPDGSVWEHFPDTKQLWLKSGPVKEPHVYPKFTAEEWANVIATQNWPAGKIPANEVKDSFHVWN